MVRSLSRILFVFAVVCPFQKVATAQSSGLRDSLRFSEQMKSRWCEFHGNHQIYSGSKTDGVVKRRYSDVARLLVGDGFAVLESCINADPVWDRGIYVGSRGIAGPFVPNGTVERGLVEFPLGGGVVHELRKDPRAIFFGHLSAIGVSSGEDLAGLLKSARQIGKETSELINTETFQMEGSTLKLGFDKQHTRLMEVEFDQNNDSLIELSAKLEYSAEFEAGAVPFVAIVTRYYEDLGETAVSTLRLIKTEPTDLKISEYRDILTNIRDDTRVNVTDHPGIQFVWRGGSVVRKVDGVALSRLVKTDFSKGSRSSFWGYVIGIAIGLCGLGWVGVKRLKKG